MCVMLCFTLLYIAIFVEESMTHAPPTIAPPTFTPQNATIAPRHLLRRQLPPPTFTPPTVFPPTFATLIFAPTTLALPTIAPHKAIHAPVTNAPRTTLAPPTVAPPWVSEQINSGKITRRLSLKLNQCVVFLMLRHLLVYIGWPETNPCDISCHMYAFGRHSFYLKTLATSLNSDGRSPKVTDFPILKYISPFVINVAEKHAKQNVKTRILKKFRQQLTTCLFRIGFWT